MFSHPPDAPRGTVKWSRGYASLTPGYKPQLRLGLCSFRTLFRWQSVRYPYLIDLLDLREIIKNICVREQVTISISEADLQVVGGTPHRSLCSLCVVLTINQRLRRCAAADLTRISTRFLARIGTTCGDMWKSVFLETRSGF